MGSQRVVIADLQKRLENELERLKRLFKMCYDLKVVWLPNSNSDLSGEVKDETIFIYEGDFDIALKTLKHEFLDYAISQVIEPYRRIANQLILLINEEAYRRKEELIEKLSEVV